MRLHFDGNRAASDAQLRAVTWIDKNADPPEDPSPRAILERDILLLKGIYYDLGYINAEIGEPVVTEATDGPFIDVTMRITTEGPRFKIGQLTMFESDDSGARVPALDNMDLRKRMSIPDGGWFARDVMQRELATLRTVYRDRGYANVDMTPEMVVDAGAKTVNITVPIHRGPLCRVERIVVAGNKKTSTDRIVGEVTVETGALFNETVLADSRKRLERMLLFKTVDVSTEKGSAASQIVVKITVGEE